MRGTYKGLFFSLILLMFIVFAVFYRGLPLTGKVTNSFEFVNEIKVFEEGLTKSNLTKFHELGGSVINKIIQQGVSETILQGEQFKEQKDRKTINNVTVRPNNESLSKEDKDSLEVASLDTANTTTGNFSKHCVNILKTWNGNIEKSISSKDDTGTRTRPHIGLIVTTFRSGSTFLGDALASHPAVYYSFEPFFYKGTRKLFPEETSEGDSGLKALMNCRLTDEAPYAEVLKVNSNVRNYNKFLKELFDNDENIECWSANFFNGACRLFPFQVIKTVRLDLNAARSILEDSSLNVQVILLVRDPRGILSSREVVGWCSGQCLNASLLCNDHVNNYHAFAELKKDFPDRLRVVRYEELALDPINLMQQIFNFLHFPMHKDVSEFLRSHTSKNEGGPHSTVRNSVANAFHWTTKLNFTQIEEIQLSCTEALNLWGFKLIRNSTEMNNFTSLLPIKFS